ncbi:hypothetical protein NM688_g5492 [Phlebia brevispora]|uniref:Uncharacterized protein n=1 Tax=Phlebia brevispora TaxID=194682 RepID=A0ACC1SUQ8_9APHY|nr:hypothetical protein NM688_g5492 [Phlebia brevispora]
MMMFHVVCARILRHIFGCTAKTMEAMYSLCEIEKVLGPTMLDVNSGRLRHVRYEEAGEKVDVRPYYELEEDFARFDWARFKQDGFEWTYTRPDTCVHVVITPFRSSSH